jgi:hypothetical protein
VKALWDRGGRVVGWFEQDRLYSIDGHVKGWLVTGNLVYSRRGQHVGWFEQGQFWDLNGQVVTFTNSSSGGPSKPGLSGVPGVPGISGTPGVPGLGGVHGKPGFSGSWSAKNWDTYLSA